MKPEESQTASATTTAGEHDKAHPVGSGVGAAAGAATGAAVGTAIGGPVGTLVGAAVGALAGGLVGHGIAEGISPPVEDAYWRENYRSRPYVDANRSYDEYQPAYRYGWESRGQYAGKRFEDVESDLERYWDRARGRSYLTWNEARNAARDAWHHVEDRMPGPVARGYYTGVYTRDGSMMLVPSAAAAEINSSGDREWDQIYPTHSRAGALRVPLQELHDPASGRLDAARVAEYLKVPLKSLAEAVGKNYSTIHKTPAAPDVQPVLQSIKTSLVILEDVLGNRSAVLAWLNHPHPDLGQTPLDVILQGYPDAVKHMLQAAIIGTPS